MATEETLAQLSNNLVYGSMVMFAGALVAFSAELAFGDKGRVARTSDAQARQSVEQYERAQAGGATAVITRTEVDVAAPPAGAPSRKAEKAGRIGVSLTVLAFLLLLGGVVARGLSAGRLPWGNMYEFSLTAALAVTGTFLVLLWRRDVRYLGLFVVMPVLLTLGLAVTLLYTDSAQLVPALKSYWLGIHVTAAIIASGIFTLGAITSALYLLQQRWERTGSGGRIAQQLPSSQALDRSAYRIHAFGFPLWTFAVVAGAIWAENAWGRYWGWDPKETWAFITWVVYACYLHARATAGWKGKGAAVIALIGFTCFLFNYFGVNLFGSGLHSYGGVHF